MKRLLLAASAAAIAGMAQADRYVMITHTMGTDPFWPVAETGGRDAATQIGAEFEHMFAPSGDMADMARLIESATATMPDGLVVTLPDAAALGQAVASATEAGIPVITINSGEEASKELGALMHIGQSSAMAGHGAGERLLAEGPVGKALCLNHEAFNTDLVTRCQGFFDALDQPLNMIDVSNDVAQIKTRTAAALQSDQEIDTLLAIAPHTCEAAAAAVEEAGATGAVKLVCFDLSPGVLDLIEAGKVDFTIDQQPYLQAYLAVTFLNLYNTRSGMIPPEDVPSGPGFVDATNAAAVREQAGTYR
ncbi:substrate-binding domain-containing protein [Poseidonocella sp. HB161398]|uniref:substrate-binding domain-containing protein n=1 Tax=Poseidonocella sp. HB161398 TaxID=2320855 RepID=UPI001107CD66|nr:substrate-binding domain-containing protein [Poseidonocella sp. HB161398]